LFFFGGAKQRNGRKGHIIVRCWRLSATAIDFPMAAFRGGVKFILKIIVSDQ
jgi:hypothetical protein